MRIALLSAFALTLLWSGAASAQWTQPEGEQYGRVWVRALVGSQGHGLDGETIETAPYTNFSMRIYHEYGLLDGLTLNSYFVPIGHATMGESESVERLAYVGPVSLGLRQALYRGDVKIAIAGHVEYSAENFEKDLAPEGEDYAFTPVVGGVGAGGDLQVGYAFSRYWVQGRAGMNVYTQEERGPALTAHFQFGANLPRGFQLNFRSFMLWPLDEITEVNVAGAGETRYVSLGFGLSWWISENFGLTLGIDGAQLEESNAATPTPTLGVEWR